MADLETLLADTRYWVDQGSDPSAPSAGEPVTYTKSGLLYVRNSADIVGPLIDETAHDALDHTGLPGVGGGGGLINPFVGTGQCSPSYGGSVGAAFVANRAYIERFVAIADVTFSTVYWNATASAGNMDFAIYNNDLSSKLGSTGSFASPGTGQRSQALGGSVNLTAGTVYYFAWVTDSASYQASQRFSTHVGALNFFGTKNSSGPALPATLAVGTWTTNGAGGLGFPVYHFA